MDVLPYALAAERAIAQKNVALASLTDSFNKNTPLSVFFVVIKKTAQLGGLNNAANKELFCHVVDLTDDTLKVSKGIISAFHRSCTIFICEL